MKKNEFRELKQGSMSVSEYLNKFTQLSRYAPEDVATDDARQATLLVVLTMKNENGHLFIPKNVRIARVDEAM